MSQVTTQPLNADCKSRAADAPCSMPPFSASQDDNATTTGVEPYSLVRWQPHRTTPPLAQFLVLLHPALAVTTHAASCEGPCRGSSNVASRALAHAEIQAQVLTCASPGLLPRPASLTELGFCNWPRSLVPDTCWCPASLCASSSCSPWGNLSPVASHLTFL
eukprot:4395829-Pyramimonas_sp.AAC.1